MKRDQRQYDKQFKFDAVNHFLASNKPACVIAEHFVFSDIQHKIHTEKLSCVKLNYANFTH